MNEIGPQDAAAGNTAGADSTAKEIADNTVISCADCNACCCRLEVMLQGEDDVPLDMVAYDRWGGWVMARLADGRCVALDRHTFRCTIYARRPTVCRDYAAGDYECLQERLQRVA